MELRRIDVCVEVSMMSSQLALPRRGHIEQVLHMFRYVNKHQNAEMVFDPSEPYVSHKDLKHEEWYSSFCREIKEELPPNMPYPRGLGLRMRVHANINHDGYSVTQKSRNGFVVFMNEAPIYWMSKKQTSRETSTFGSNFVAMKEDFEYARVLRYKIRMFGIPCEEPTVVYGYNQSVLANTSVPYSTTKEKSKSISLHLV